MRGTNAYTNSGTDDAFSFIGAAEFSDTAGERWVTQNGSGNRLLRGDVDGDDVADFRIDVDDFGGALEPSDLLRQQRLIRYDKFKKYRPPQSPR